MAQKPNLGVIKEGLGRFDRDIELEKYIEEDAQLLEQVRQGLGSTKNVIRIGQGPSMDFLQNVIYLTLDVGHGVEVSYN